MKWCLGAAVLAASLLLAACGGDEGGEPSPEQAKRCLEENRIRVLGPVDRSADDDDAPDTELIVGDGRFGAFVAYYDSEDRAEKLAGEVEDRSKEFGGTVSRHGKVTIIYTKGFEDREKLEDCVLS